MDNITHQKIIIHLDFFKFLGLYICIIGILLLNSDELKGEYFVSTFCSIYILNLKEDVAANAFESFINNECNPACLTVEGLLTSNY